MLVYVQENKIDDVLCPVDIPEELRNRFENEKKEELEKNRQRELAEHCNKVALVTDNDLRKDHFVYDIGDFETIRKRQFSESAFIPKNAKYPDVYKQVANAFELPVHQIRLWRYETVKHEQSDLQIHRPYKLIPRESSFMSWAFGDEWFEYYDDNVFYVEIAKSMKSAKFDEQPNLELDSYDEKKSALVFIKFYDTEMQKFVYVGSLIALVYVPFDIYAPRIKSMIGLESDIELIFHLVSGF